MAGITLADAEAQLALWVAASAALAGAQSYTITSGDSTRSLTRADLGDVMEQIKFWDGWVKRLTPRTRSRTRFVVPG